MEELDKTKVGSESW